MNINIHLQIILGSLLVIYNINTKVHTRQNQAYQPITPVAPWSIKINHQNRMPAEVQFEMYLKNCIDHKDKPVKIKKWNSKSKEFKPLILIMLTD